MMHKMLGGIMRKTRCSHDFSVLSSSLHLIPRPLSHWVDQGSGVTGMISFQVLLYLSVSPREGATVKSAAPRFSIEISPCSRHLDRLFNLSSAVRTAYGLGELVRVFSAVLLETIGVTTTGVAHVSTASLGERRALQEDGIVWRFHADYTLDVLPLAWALSLDRRLRLDLSLSP